MTKINVTATTLPEVLILEPRVFADERGCIFETFNERDFGNIGITERFCQDNHSHSGKGVLRGLHYQLRQSQAKLVRVVIGAVFDVAVDLRRNSPNFGKWTGAYLTAENRRMLWIPRGFAHGFLVTSETADVLYKATDLYAPEWERTIAWNDPDIGIQWPLSGLPILSPKDSAGRALRDAEVFDAIP